MGYRAFNSNKIFYFNYIINRIGKKVVKNNSKKLKKKQGNRQRQIFQIETFITYYSI